MKRMNLLIRCNRVRQFLWGALSVFFILIGSPKLAAQSLDDFEIKTTVTHSKCGGIDGDIVIEVSPKPGHPVGEVIKTYRLDTKDGQPLTPSGNYVVENKFPVGSGIYIPRAKVQLKNSGVSFFLTGSPITVTSSYVPMTTTVTLERKSLNKYKPEGASEYKLTGIVSLFVKDGTAPYKATILSSPNTYKGKKVFTDLENGKKKYLYELPVGEYVIQMSDACGKEAPAISVKMEYVASDLPQGGAADFPYWKPYMNFYMKQTKCGWVAFWHNKRPSLHYEEPTRDIYPYINNLDTLSKYYHYGFQTIAESKQGKKPKYYAYSNYGGPNKHDETFGVGSEQIVVEGIAEGSLYYRMPEGKSYEEMWLKEEYWPEVFLQVVGSDEQMREGFNPYKPKDGKTEPFPKLLEHYLENRGDVCNDKYGIRMRPHKETVNLMCLPLTGQLKEKGSSQIIETKEFNYIDHHSDKGGKYTKFDTDLSRDKTYEVIVTDTRGSKQILEFEPMEKTRYDQSIALLPDYCEGKNRVDMLIRAYPIAKAMKGHIIRFVSAPKGFKPLEGAMKVGDVYTVPNDFESSFFHVFSERGKEREKTYIHIPAGKYEFEVEICNKKYKVEKVFTEEELSKNRPKYTENRDAFTPHFSKEECGYARVFPFAGNGKDLLKKDGKSTSVNLLITKYPDGIGKKDIRTNLKGTALAHWNDYGVISTHGEDDPSKIYIDVPETRGDMEVRLIYAPDKVKSEQLLPCLSTYSFRLSNALLSYDREKYIGYICPNNSSGLIRVNPINYVGDVRVSLFRRDATDEDLENDSKALASIDVSLEDLKKGKGAEFRLGSNAKDSDPKIPVDPQGYKAKIVDKKCKNSSIEKLIVYSLPSPIAIQSKDQKRKFCEGETIELMVAAINASDDENAYVWELPNKNVYKGRKLKIENATSDLSGTFKVTINGIMCDGHPNGTVTIEFPISVAPRLLWWRKDAVDANWHNVKNWANEEGKPVNAVPASCTTVHIPAKVDKAFPDLGAETKRETYGNPECDKLYLHHGSQLGNPHFLSYQKAYVDYNFGILDADHQIKAHREQYFPEADSKLMDRDQWYMIAAPLKEIFSGDFGLAGYPKTYQRYLKIEVGGNKPTDASFKKPINNLVEKLSDHNGAMALKVGKYQAGIVGYDDHKHLNKLNGIVRVPFFEDGSRVSAYPLHYYDGVNSIFGYYNDNTLQPVNKTDKGKRSKDAYRFIFEGADRKIGNVILSGTPERGYVLSLKEGMKADDWFMMGNPFMTPIDFDKFWEANKDVIYPYYYIFNGKSGVWEFYNKENTGTSVNLGKSIAPLQSIVLRKKNAATELIFPVGSNTVLLPSWRTELGTELVELRSASDESTVHPLSVRVSNTRGQETISYLSWEGKGSVPALSNSEYSFVPTVFFVDPETGASNVVESPTKAYGAFALGVEATLGGEMEMSFDQLDRSVYEQLTLIDKMEGKEQDLLSNSTYRFVHQPSDRPAERFVLKVKRFGVENEPTALESIVSPNLHISRRGDLLHIDSSVGLRSVVIFDMQGRRCGEWQFAGSTNADIDIDSNVQGVVMIDLRLEDGSRQVRKFDMAN
ncbi:hypothetical protein PORCRE_238 [Porphyromonas crevioricanis JCM 15906]|uniref:UBX domain-containing protein n=2 Tax=Porphyromonas crevioricanis TaxID=393921 RepID=S4NB98_9PORP|nr:hypothetical protein PORCRE_238 [Porphyromonas crevioricanis JCM 15906]SJZ83940.1 hypothetical protein SAMN02745203_01015 [Porphyromonas crevioricanis]